MHKILRHQNDKRFLYIQIGTFMGKEYNCYYFYIGSQLLRDLVQSQDAFFQKSTLHIKSISKKIRSSNLPDHIIKVINNYELGQVLILKIQYYHFNILKFIGMSLLNYDITLGYNLKISKRVIIVITYLN